MKLLMYMEKHFLLLYSRFIVFGFSSICLSWFQNVQSKILLRSLTKISETNKISENIRVRFMRTIPKLFFSVALAGSALVMAGCQTAEPYVSYPYEVTAQNARILKRLDVKDVAVEQVRVVKAMDLECAGNNIPIPGQEGFKTINGAFSNYWRNALMSDLNQAGTLNQKNPKVKIYNLIDSVKIQAEPTFLAWRINMELFSSNGHSMKLDVVYNAPTDGLKNMQDGCRRVAETLNKAVKWSVLKAISDPKFEALVQPGLDFTPSMKAQSFQSLFLGEDEDDRWVDKAPKKLEN